MNTEQENDIDIDNYPIGIVGADYVPPLEFNAPKLVEYLKTTGKTFTELTEEEINQLK